MTLIAVIFSLGCKERRSTTEPVPSPGPKTSFGSAVESAKNVQKNLGSRDEEVATQAKDLGSE